MLNQQTIEKLYTLRLRGMADGFTQQQEDPQTGRVTISDPLLHIKNLDYTVGYFAILCDSSYLKCLNNLNHIEGQP